MSAEAVVQEFLQVYESQGIGAAVKYLADDLTLRQPGMPDGGQREFIGIGSVTKEAMPDFRWGVQTITTNGSTIAVDMRWTGTHTGIYRLSLLMPGAQDIPPTGKAVSVEDRFVFTVSGEKISAINIEWPPGGGLPSFMAQLGVTLPTP
jgi:hypothetical protein